MFNQLTLKDFFIVLLLLILTMLSVHFYVDNQARAKLWHDSYPLRARLALANASCSEGSPPWMLALLKTQVWQSRAPSNQLAYLSPSGELFHCENGYQGQWPLISNAVDAQTRFRFASVSKLWTSDVILDLIKSGDIELQTPLAALLNEIDEPKDSRVPTITIKNLLEHRGGFNRYSALYGHDMFGIGEEICPHHLARLNDIELFYPPGEIMSYSNLGYCLLGVAAARMAGDSWQELVAKKYNFTDNGFEFITNKALDDEVFYNYVDLSLTGIGDIYSTFNYEDAVAALGVSGNASELVQQVGKMAQKPPPNILSFDENDCDVSQLRDCYGYAMFPLQKNGEDLMLYFRDGNLFGLSSLVVVDSHGGTMALLSNGEPEDGAILNELYLKIYDQLLQVY